MTKAFASEVLDQSTQTVDVAIKGSLSLYGQYLRESRCTEELVMACMHCPHLRHLRQIAQKSPHIKP